MTKVFNKLKWILIIFWISIETIDIKQHPKSNLIITRNCDNKNYNLKNKIDDIKIEPKYDRFDQNKSEPKDNKIFQTDTNVWHRTSWHYSIHSQENSSSVLCIPDLFFEVVQQTDVMEKKSTGCGEGVSVRMKWSEKLTNANKNSRMCFWFVQLSIKMSLSSKSYFLYHLILFQPLCLLDQILVIIT